MEQDEKKLGRQYAVPAERQEIIMRHIRVKGSAQIKELAEWLDVSEATIRRDLDDLDQQGRVKRTHGGAISSHYGTSFEHQYEEKQRLMQEEKRRIAQKAASYVNERDTIFLDSGTTAYLMGTYLRDIPNISVFTYDTMIASSIDLHQTSSMIVTGGVRRTGYNNVLLGSYAENFLRGLRVDKVFLGADAVDLDFGISNSNMMEAEIKRVAQSIGGCTFLMTDQSKFDKVALAKVCALEKIDVLITDKGTEEKYLEELKKKIKQVVTV